MTNSPKAWIWSQYQGVVSENGGTAAPLPLLGNALAKALQANETESASARRAKRGAFLAATMIIGLLFPKIAFLLALFSGLMILSGLAPQRVEDFFNAVPGGAIVLKVLAISDAFLP